MTTKHDHPSCVEHVLRSTYVFSTLLGYWVQMRGIPKGLVHNLLLQFFTLVTSKIAVFDSYFFHIVTTQNDPATYVKHVSGSIYVFSFTFFGYWLRGGGGGSRDLYTTCFCSFSGWAAQKFRFLKPTFFDIVTTQKDHATYTKHALGSIYGFPPIFWYGVQIPRDWYTTCFCSFSP